MRGLRRSPPAPNSRFVLEAFEPAYLRLWRAGGMRARVEDALAELRQCRVCPRNCGNDRLADERRACGTGRHAIVSSAFAHFGEEACLRGWNGSGTLFFGLCNLRCVFCQNWDISQQPRGRELDAEEIARLMLGLQREGCHNINFVTPEHVAPQVVEAIAAAVPLGLRVPIVYNTSAYDSLRSLQLLDGLVDVYMPDFKFWEPATARRLARAGDYPDVARAAIREMHRQVGDLRFGSDGLARRGLLVRHLVLPGQTAEAAAILGWLGREISPDTYLNLMAQYRPAYRVGEAQRDGRRRFAEIDRAPTPGEVRSAYRAARAAGLWRFDARA